MNDLQIRLAHLGLSDLPELNTIMQSGDEAAIAEFLHAHKILLRAKEEQELIAEIQKRDLEDTTAEDVNDL